LKIDAIEHFFEFWDESVNVYILVFTLWK